MILHVGARIRWVPRCGESRRVCERINTSKDLWYREPRRLSLSLSPSLRGEGAKGWPSARAGTGSPAASRTRAQAAAEQMGSISYFVTPVGRPALRFHQSTHAPAYDLFQLVVPRLVAPRCFCRFPLAPRRNNAATECSLPGLFIG